MYPTGFIQKHKAGLWGLAGVFIFFVGCLLMIIVSFISLFFGGQPNSGFNSGSPTDLATAEIGQYMPLFQQAQQYYGVSWAVLAAIASIESGFGKSPYYLERNGVSEAGAVGFMQFMPTTWSGSKNPNVWNNPTNPRWDENPATIQAYGGYGIDANHDGRADPFNPEDAIMSAAKYLKANNFENDPRGALYHYNHAEWYINQVLAKAETYAQMTPVGNGDWPLPVQWAEITSQYGKRLMEGKEEFHGGIDIACPIGTPVYAVRSGQVKISGWVSGYGYCVMMNHPGDVMTVYGHLSTTQVSVGQMVETGQVIALSGNTGRTTGPHLHFEVRLSNRTCNPLDWLKVPSQNY